jgi:hypothetical protein
MPTPSERETFTLPISSGILEHREHIGPAIWVFLWMIDRTTDEKRTGAGQYEGLVLGGSPINTRTIADQLGENVRTVQAHVNRLCDGSKVRPPYLRRILHRPGNAFGYAVLKSKKWIGRRQQVVPDTPAENLRTSGSSPAEKPQGREENLQGCAKNLHTPAENLRANKEDNTGTITKTSTETGERGDEYPDTVPPGFDALTYAKSLLHKLFIPAEGGNLKHAKAAIVACANEHSISLSEATRFIYDQALMSRQEDVPVNGWWFHDSKYNPEVRHAKSKPVTFQQQRKQTTRESLTVAIAERELQRREGSTDRPALGCCSTDVRDGIEH